MQGHVICSFTVITGVSSDEYRLPWGFLAYSKCSKINASHCSSDLLWINTDGSVKMVWHQFDFITRNGHIYLAGVLSCKAKVISSALTVRLQHCQISFLWNLLTITLFRSPLYMGSSFVVIVIIYSIGSRQRVNHYLNFIFTLIFRNLLNK